MARVLIVGGGAREHALAYALRGHELLLCPGNGGSASLGKTIDLAPSDIEKIADLAARERVDLVVVGPELPLTLGLADAVEARGIRVFGPSKKAARLEGSKAFMKEFLARHGIVTAPFTVFDDAEKAKAHARAEFAAGRPLVVKADGLCAGKGVVVADDADEVIAAIDRMMVLGELGDAGKIVVLEQRLGGEEASFHAVCDGMRAVPLVAAQDHKRIFDGDRGPNTGGMGAYAPAPVVTEAIAMRVMTEIVEPTVAGMAREGTPFKGVLFVGLMIEGDAVRVLEFNVRFGDPETTVLVPMFDGDWFALLDGSARGDVSGVEAKTRKGAALSVVMAAEGYPGKPAAGDAIRGLDAPLAEGAFVFHAGTKREGDAVLTAGGRVLAVGAHAASFEDARAIAYETVRKIHWRGEQHRTDIGHHAMRKAR